MEKIGYINKNGDFEEFRIAFVTLGCKVNRYESDAIRQAFEDLGFVSVAESESADVYVVNTCTVTSEADRKSGQMIRRMKKRNPDAIVAAMGCRIEIRGESAADVAAGTKNRLSIVESVVARLRVLWGDSFLEASVSSVCPTEMGGPVVSQEETRAYIKIEDGCDAFCSYCIIPFARGRVKSRPRAEILQEASLLCEKGFREVVLTGIHLCSYGKDIGEGILSVAEILEEIGKLDGISRIRLGSLEPKSLTPVFVERIAGVEKLCPHFHLSLQSLLCESQN